MARFLSALLFILVTACGSTPGFGFLDGGVEDGSLVARDGGTSFDKDAACATLVVPTTRAPGAILLVVDRSFSMSEDANGTQPKFPGDAKWDVAQPILIDLVKGLPTGLELGVELFPSALGCAVAAAPQVQLGDITTTRASVVSTLSGAGPVGDTPTTPALQLAFQALAQRTDAGAKVVVFLSDGAPNCGSSESSVQAAVADAAKKSGIKTYVVGIPGSPYTSFSKLAVAGGTRRTPQCLEVCDATWSDVDKCCHYVASAQDFKKTLTQALSDIAAKLKTDCIYKVPKPTNGFSPDLVNVSVSLDGTTDNVVVRDDDPNAGGWSYTDATDDYLVLHGKICADILASKSSHVEIVVGCPTRVN